MHALVARSIDSEDPLSAFSYVRNHPKPLLPTASSVIVHVAYAGINPADLQYVDGTYKNAPAHPMPKFPCPMGVDGTGTVVACGPKVSKFKPRDSVLGLHQRMDEGTFAEFATFEESELALKPAGVCEQLAAAMPVACITAFCALLKCPELQRFRNSCPSSCNQHSVKRVLINGSSGGVGSFAVLLAKHYFKVPVVLATCSKRNISYVKHLGADVTIDYTMASIQALVQHHLQQLRLQHEEPVNVAAASPIAAAAAAGQPKVVRKDESGTATPASAPPEGISASAAAGEGTSKLAETAETAPTQRAAPAHANAPAAASDSNSSSRAGREQPDKLDLVIDNVGGLDNMAMSCRLLKPGEGTYVSSVPIGNRAKPSAPSSILSFFLMLGARSLLQLVLPWFNPRVVFNGAQPDGAILQHLVNWFDSVPELGCSSPETCRVRLTVFDLEEGVKALEVVRSGRAVGKMVLKVPQQVVTSE
jgi:NADPH:quinone reductase-like Zn-dependent oxidoreductase